MAMVLETSLSRI